MTTITISENINFKKRHFESVEELQEYLLLVKQEEELSNEHKSILDERLEDLKNNPKDSLSLEELKSSIERR